jgi:hypothetical protein
MSRLHWRQLDEGRRLAEAVSFPDERLSARVLLSSFAARDAEEWRQYRLRGNEGLLAKVDSEAAR